VQIPIFPHLFSEEMICFGSKHNFFKNQDAYFLALKCKTTPIPAKSAELAQNSKNTSKGCRKKKS
jgi:hypothetical protein